MNATATESTKPFWAAFWIVLAALFLRTTCRFGFEIGKAAKAANR